LWSTDRHQDRAMTLAVTERQSETLPMGARPSILLLVVMVALSPFAINVIAPSLPGLAEAFRTDYGTAQLTLTWYLAGVAAGQLVFGPLSDRFGRRPVLLVGLTTYVVGSLACLLAPTIDLLIAGRVAQALGGCAGMVLSRAIVRDVWGRDRAASVLGYVTMGMALAPMLAPTIGGLLESWFGWRAAYWAMLGGGIAVVVFATARLPETHFDRTRSISPGALASGYAVLLRNPLFVAYTATGMFNTCQFFAFLGAAPFVAMSIIGVEPYVYGLYFMMISVGYMMGNFVSGRFATRFGVQRMLLLGCSTCLVATLILAVCVHVGPLTALDIFLPMSLGAMGSGMILPSAMAGAVGVTARAAGAASGLMGFVQMAAGAMASFAVSHFDGVMLEAMVVAVVLSASAAFVSQLFTRALVARQAIAAAG
jgi:DHA1 family bicyclomycin/chloramphenicol resistance-like MFS transporter